MENIIINNYIRSWMYDNEVSKEGISFSLKSKPEERFLLVKDKNYQRTWNLHFLTTKGILSESDKCKLVSAIEDYIQEGEYLTTCGYCTKGGIYGFRRFSWNTTKWKDTGMLRVLHDKYSGEPVYFPILQKL